MSLTQPSLQERRPSPNLNLSFASNNPFRQRATSPAGTAPSASPTRLAPDENSNSGAISTNPFLDNYQPANEFENEKPRAPSPRRAMPDDSSTNREVPVRARNAAELINGLTLGEQPASERNLQPRRPVARTGTSESTGHRITRSGGEDGHARRSQDEERRPRREPRDPTRRRAAITSSSPEKRENQRPVPRRNSDTSILDVLDEERKSKSAADRGKDGKTRDPKAREGRSGRSGKPNRRVDLIDKLDVTGIYGGATFHHDGPFDACNPHRNRKNARAAPMRAFAEGSANNALGGSGPVNKGIDFDQFHGRSAQGFTDYNASSFGAPADPFSGFRRGFPEPRRGDPAIIDPKARTQYVVGNESAGLGTSTFLEGTPVSRVTLQRRESENDGASGHVGLQRKKSLAQKIRGISRPRGGLDTAGRVTSPGADHPGRVRSPEGQYIDIHTGHVASPGSPRYVQSAGGSGKMQEHNPFFENVTAETKEPPVSEAKVPDSDQEVFVSITRARTASSPQQPMARRPTIETAENAEGMKAGGGGLLSRVKSLKGGKKTRPDRSGSASQGAT